jgi:4'-phosphopantetheinyl transferase
MGVDAVSVLWSGDTGFPGPAALTVIGVRGQPDRETARLRIRAALVEALAAHCGIDAGRIQLHSPEGAAPWAVAALDGGERRIALAISHDGDISVAAYALDGGAVGIDVTSIVPVPDWEPVARDYLGLAAAQALAALPAGERDAAFARAWSEHEARLKCLGWQLDEWRAEREPMLKACRCQPLALADGYVGYVALAPAAE